MSVKRNSNVTWSQLQDPPPQLECILVELFSRYTDPQLLLEVVLKEIKDHPEILPEINIPNFWDVNSFELMQTQGQIGDYYFSGDTIEKITGINPLQFTQVAYIKGNPGREVEMRSNSTHVQWKFTDELVWKNLVKISDLYGPEGPQGPVGPQGDSPYIGPNDNWWVGGVDTGVPLYVPTDWDDIPNKPNLLESGDNISELTNDAGYISTETDPTVPSHVKGISSSDLANWNDAFSWGNHALENYLKPGDNVSELNNDAGYITALDIPPLNYVPLTRVLSLMPGSGISIATPSYDLSSNRTWNIGIDPSYTGFLNYYTSSQVDTILLDYMKKTDLTANFNPVTGILDIFNDSISLDGRYSLLGHTHTIPDVTGLQAALDGKEPVFSKGDLLVDSNMTITGTGKLVGGNLSIGIDMSKFYTRTELQTSGSASVHWDNITNVPSFVQSSRQIIAGTGLSGGGNLGSDVTISFDTTWGDARYLQSFTETDPTVPSHVKAITASNISNWNTAFGWGNHATQGYIKVGDNISDLVNDAGYITSFDNDYISSVSLSGDDLIFVGSGGAFNGTISLAALHHPAVSLGTANGLTINAATQVLSLGLASTSSAGAMSAADKIKLDGLSNYSHPTQTAISVTATGIEVMSSVAVNTLGHVTSFTKRTLPTANGTTAGVLSAADWTTFNNKQAALVSGTNIKTINGVSLLGSGDLSVGGVAITDEDNVVRWTTTSANPTIRFKGEGDTSIAYDPGTRTIIINSIPGAGTGGAVTSFNGRVGGVTSQTGDYTIAMMGDVTLTSLANLQILRYDSASGNWVNTTLNTSIVPEGTNQYFTQARARTAVSLTTTGNSGAATYNNSTGVFNIPNYTLAGLGGQPLNSILTSIASLPTNQTGRIKLTNGVASLDTTVYLTTETDPIFVASAAYGITSTNISNWNALVGHNHTLDSLSNVTIGTKAAGNLLQWNGTAWVNVTPASLGFTSNTGTVTSIVAGNGLVNGTITTTGSIVLGTPSAITLSSTNSVTAESHTHAFTPGGTTAQYITGAGTLATFPTSMAPTAGSGNYIQNQIASAQTASAWIGGIYRTSSRIEALYGTSSTGTYGFSLGHARTVDGAVSIQFAASVTNANSWDALINRSGGENGGFYINNRGSGIVVINSIGGGDIMLQQNSVSKLRIYSSGNIRLGGGVDSGLATLQVTGAIQQTSVVNSLLKTNASGVLVAATNADLVALLGTGNYVTTNTPQTGLSGTKQWTDNHNWVIANSITDYTSTPLGITFLKSYNAANGPTASGYYTGIQFSSNNDPAYKHQLVVSTSDGWWIGRNGSNWRKLWSTADFTGTTAQYVAGNGTIRTSATDFILNQNSSAQTGNFWVNGTGNIGGNLIVGRASTSNIALFLGRNRTGDGHVDIQFSTSITNAESWDALIHRSSGENGNLNIIQKGSGNISIHHNGTGSFSLNRSGTLHFQMFGSNNFRIGGGSDNGFGKLQVAGAINQTSVTNALIKADGNGTLVAATAGTDYLTSATLPNNYVWKGINNTGSSFAQSADLAEPLPGYYITQINTGGSTNLPTGFNGGALISGLDSNNYGGQLLIGRNGNVLSRGITAGVLTNWILLASQEWVIANYTPLTRTLTAGNGLTGGGTLAADRTFTLGTPSNITLGSTNSVTSTSHTHAFVPGGTTAQYIRGDGTLATFPTIGNGTLTLNTGINLTGSGTFTANQTGGTSINFDLPTFDASLLGIAATIGGTTAAGYYIQSTVNGNFVIGIQNNGGDDSFNVISKAGNTAGTGNYDKLVLKVRADGFVEIPNLGGTGNRLVYTTSTGRLSNLAAGTTAQYIRGDGSLATFPTIGNGTLTLATGTEFTGSASFTANQTGNTTFTIGLASGLQIPTTTQVTSWNTMAAGSYVTTNTDQLAEITGRKHFHNRFSVGYYDSTLTPHNTYTRFSVAQSSGLNLDVAQTTHGYNTTFLFGAYLDNSYASTDLFAAGNIKYSGNGNEYVWRPGAFTFLGNGGTFLWRLGASPANGAGKNTAVASWTTLMQLRSDGLTLSSLASATTNLVVATSAGLLQSKTNGTTAQYLRGDLNWRNSADDFILNQDSSAQTTARFWVSGAGSLGGNLFVGRNAGASDVFLTAGRGRTANGNVYLDLVSSTTNNTNYDLRIETQAGENSTSIIRHKGTGPFYISAENAGNLIFRTDAVERMRITPTSGLVLIGLSSNTGTARLQVSGAIRQTSVTGSLLKADSNGNLVAATAGVDYAAATGAGNYIQNQFASAQSGNAWVSGSVRAGGALEAGYGQTADALIGIGRARTTDGNSYLDFFSTAASNTAYSARIIRSSGVNGTFTLSSRGTGSLVLQTENAASIQFNTSAAVRGVINSSGQWLVGTTSNNGGYKLQIEAGGDTTAGLRVRGTIQTTSISVGSLVKVGTGNVLQAATASDIATVLGGGSYVTTNTNQTTGLTGNKTWNGIHQFLGTNTTFGSTISSPTGYKVYVNSGTVSGNGLYVYGVIVSSNDVEATSDIRRKTNIKKFNISDINFNSISSWTYNWKEDLTSKPNLGFIAQEWEHIPGVTSKDDFGYLTIRPTAIMAVMFEKVKELNNTINALKQEIKELKDAANNR